MPASAKNFNRTHTMETIIVGGVALLLFIYLFVAMIRPEKF
jgi:K+-transporting ATPase KdpF subunit